MSPHSHHLGDPLILERLLREVIRSITEPEHESRLDTAVQLAHDYLFPLQIARFRAGEDPILP